jgi:hypothetical protein
MIGADDLLVDLLPLRGHPYFGGIVKDDRRHREVITLRLIASRLLSRAARCCALRWGALCCAVPWRRPVHARVRVARAAQQWTGGVSTRPAGEPSARPRVRFSRRLRHLVALHTTHVPPSLAPGGPQTVEMVAKFLVDECHVRLFHCMTCAGFRAVYDIMNGYMRDEGALLLDVEVRGCGCVCARWSEAGWGRWGPRSLVSGRLLYLSPSLPKDRP